MFSVSIIHLVSIDSSQEGFIPPVHLNKTFLSPRCDISHPEHRTILVFCLLYWSSFGSDCPQISACVAVGGLSADG